MSISRYDCNRLRFYHLLFLLLYRYLFESINCLYPSICGHWLLPSRRVLLIDKGVCKSRGLSPRKAAINNAPLAQHRVLKMGLSSIVQHDLFNLQPSFSLAFFVLVLNRHQTIVDSPNDLLRCILLNPDLSNGIPHILFTSWRLWGLAGCRWLTIRIVPSPGAWWEWLNFASTNFKSRVQLISVGCQSALHGWKACVTSCCHSQIVAWGEVLSHGQMRDRQRLRGWSY